MRPVLEVKSAFAGSICQRLDTSVIEITATVEHHVLDALFLGAFGDQLADRLGRLDVGAGLGAFAQRLLKRRGGSDRPALLVVDELSMDMLGRAKHGPVSYTHLR